MGTYYRIVCDELRQFIEPAEITTLANPKGWGIKAGPIIFSHIAKVVAWWAIHGGWQNTSFKYVGDNSGGAYERCDDPPWVNVTKQAVEAFNADGPYARDFGVGWRSAEEDY